MVIILAGLLIYGGYFLGTKREIIQPEIIQPEIIQPEKPEISVLQALQEVSAGHIGETGKEVPFVSPAFPLVIYRTSGIITEIKSDRIILKGDGTNFADGKSRTIIAIVTNFTTVSMPCKEHQLITYTWARGGKYLQKGLRVLIDSQENIRGKTEFKAKTINILE